jgi:lysophospholipase L1-like esterase
MTHVSAGRSISLCVALIVLAARVASGQTISQAGWSLHFVDSQESEVCCYLATNAFDSDASTMWATRWSSASPVHPHEIQINLGAVYNVTGFRYLPRQDGQPQGNISQYEFYVSMDGVNWGAAVATGTFANNAMEKQVMFTSKTGRYVRLRALGEVIGNPWTTVAELNVVGTSTEPPSNVIPKTNWSLHFVDSQETVICCYLATNAFDSNPNTMWATRWSGGSPPHPHEIQINLGAVYNVNGFRYLPRQDGEPQGFIGGYEFYVSMDGTNWGAAVATGTFPSNSIEKQVTFAAKSGRFIRLRALNEFIGNPWTTVAELNVLAAGAPTNQPPDGTITSPSGNVTIAPGQSVSFAGTGSDPENNVPLTYSWNFGSGGPPPSTSQNPGSVTFPNAGVFNVTFTVTDSLGLPDPTPATRTITVQGATSGATLISQTGWSVRFVDAEETIQPGYLAASAIDGNPNTSWATPWYFVPGIPPPHEIQIDMGASQNVVGFRYLPHQAWQPGRVAGYEFYVSADGVNWGAPVAIGTFPDVNSGGSRDVMFTPKAGRYVRFRALGELHDRYLTFLAELNVWRAGTGANQAPVASMVSPSQNISIRAGTAVNLAGSANDPDGHLPLSFRWSLGAGSGISDRTTLNPGIVHFDRAGTFPLTLTVTDALGASSSVTRTVTVTGGQALAKTNWTLRFVDSQETGYAATNAFDSNPNTLWTTEWVAAEPPPPHEIQIDLGPTPRDVVGFRYLPRQDEFTTGNIGRYEFYVSADGTNWGAAVATGTFSHDSTEKTVTFPFKSGRYIRLRALSEVDAFPYTVVAELTVLERQCLATPSVQLIQPRTGYIQRSSTLQIAADACTSAGGQGVRFAVDGVTVATDFAAPFSVNATGLSAGEHVVEAFLVDGGGGQIAGVTTYDRSSPVGIGDTYVAIGDGITFGLGDTIGTDDNSADGRNLLGGFESILADGLTAARGYPVSVVNEGVPGGSAFSGAALINQLLQNYPTANFVMIMYGHNDVTAQRPSGLGLVPGNPGYAGSFKDYMQRIITAVRNAGKVPLVARHAAAMPFDGPMDTALQEYNLVVDELAANPNNGIPVAPPDFYTLFRNNPALYGNDIEPNGAGYQAMAQLWLDALTP